MFYFEVTLYININYFLLFFLIVHLNRIIYLLYDKCKKGKMLMLVFISSLIYEKNY